MTPNIAVVGISAELPGGAHAQNLDHRAFFQFLLDRGEAYETIPGDRFDIDAWSGVGLGDIHVTQGAFLKDIDMFDNMEFGISSQDAEVLAPVTKKLLEHCFLALLDSGIDCRTHNVGCYTSGNTVDQSSSLASESEIYASNGSFAGFPSMVANRVSQYLDLLGPSVPTNTACSSTLTAFHLAMQAIIHGDCEAAVVGGCQLNYNVLEWIAYSQANILSDDGKCKPFDASANGFARAEGCVAVVIKDLESALRDRDHIYATILGSAINSNGSGASPGAPLAEAQYDAMVQAFKRANRKPDEVSYIELHATGTAKGDPVEVNWVGEGFRRDEEVLIGSVKGNIGHTEIVAFLVSLSKAVLMLEHRTIPPNVNLQHLNPAIEWSKFNLRVPLDTMPLPFRSGSQPLISIASSGIGGSNGHVVLEGAPTKQYDDIPLFAGISSSNRSILLVVGSRSLRTNTCISEYVAEMVSKDSEDLPNLSIVLGRRCRQMTWRSYAIIGPNPSSVTFSAPHHIFRGKVPIVFVFSGQGPQHRNMGKELFELFPIFRESVTEMDSIFKRISHKSLIDDFGLFTSAPSSKMQDNEVEIWPISLILPSIVIFQIALFDLLGSFGIKPDLIVGHSAGETAALYACGAASKSMAVEVATYRGLALSSVEKIGGTMAAFSCTAEQAHDIISQVLKFNPDSILEIACYNTATELTISGHEAAIDQALQIGHAKGYFGRKIRTGVPIHSSIMEMCRERLEIYLGEIFQRYPDVHIPKIPLHSTLTGKRFHGPFNADYFWKNTRYPVRFMEAITAISGESTNHTFVELSPHPVLYSYLLSMIPPSSTVLSTIRRPLRGNPLSEQYDLLEVCGKLTELGHNCVSFYNLNNRLYHRHVDLPTYPFSKTRYTLFPGLDRHSTQLASRMGPLNHKGLRVNKYTHPILAEHVILGNPIMPAAGFLEMAIEYGATTLMNVKFHNLLSLSSENPIKVDVHLNGSYWTVKSGTILSKSEGSTSSEKLHADGYLSFEKPESCPPLDIELIRLRCSKHIGSTKFYSNVDYFTDYGANTKRVMSLFLGSREALVSIAGMDQTLKKDAGYILHPAVLDACFHATCHPEFHGESDTNIYYLPASVGAMLLHESSTSFYFPKHIYVHVKLKEWTPNLITYDLYIANDEGTCICSLEQFSVQRNTIQPFINTLNPLEVVFQPAFSPREHSDSFNQHIDRLGFSNNSASIIDEYQVHGNWSSISECFTSAISSIIDQGKRVIHVYCIDSPAETKFFAWANQAAQIFDGIFCEVFVQDTDRKFPQKDFLMIRYANTDLANNTASFTVGLPRMDIMVYTDEGVEHASTNPPAMAIDKTHIDLLTPGGTLIQISSIQNSSYRYSNIPKDPSSASFFPLFLDSESLVFEYCYGNEEELRWNFSGLNSLQNLEIWILTTSGRNGGAALGLTRALRREYIAWSIRLVIFPSTFTEDMRHNSLHNIPAFLADEMEMVVSAAGDILVPRVAPLSRSEHYSNPLNQRVLVDSFPLRKIYSFAHTVQIRICNTVTHGQIMVHSAVVVDGKNSDVREGALVIALTSPHDLDKNTIRSVDDAMVFPIPDAMVSPGVKAITFIPGFLISILAVGISHFDRPTRMKMLRTLITHSNTTVGQTIAFYYAKIGVDFVGVPQEISLLHLSKLGHERYDLIISGYEDQHHLQLLHTLLSPEKGRLFSWNYDGAGLASILKLDPCSIGDALHRAVLCVESHIQELQDTVIWNHNADDKYNGIPQSIDSVFTDTRAKFDPEKTYLILGGIGSIGGRIAIFMYERGARHIILTSRLGQLKLSEDSATTSLKNGFGYLESLEDLELRLEAVDATSLSEMKTMLHSITPDIGGCMILTAVLEDRTFAHAEFSKTFNSKIGVFDTFRMVIDVRSLEFLIPFSSISGTFGGAGQTNYSAANTALEEAMSAVTNGFTFICPAIIDSSLMLNSIQSSSFSQIRDWSVTSAEMIIWLEDAINRYQEGFHFANYMPNLNWETMNNSFGMPKLGIHLVPSVLQDAKPTENKIDIHEIVLSVLRVDPSRFSPDIPLTAYGIDSLSASRLSYALRPIMEVTQIQLLADYTLNDLIRIFFKTPMEVSTSTMNLNNASPVASPIRKTQLMIEMLDKYSIGMQVEDPAQTMCSQVNTTGTDEDIVLLTGSTGSLGSYILAGLLEDDSITRVYAFNRIGSSGNSAMQRQIDAFVQQGIPGSLAQSPKLILMEGDLSLPDFGIHPEMMLELVSSVTHIIHNAWRVDFFAPLTEFEPLIAGTRRLLDIAVKSKLRKPPSMTFISTVGVYHNIPVGEVGPEMPIVDPEIAVGTGYTESKWIAERLIQIGADRLHLTTHVLRVGLLTGGKNGFWNPQHWIPSLVKSSIYLHCLPDGCGMISWLPVHVAANVVVGMRHLPSETLHLIHPQPVTWHTIFHSLAHSIGVPLVPYIEWFSRLEHALSHKTGPSSGASAALRLIDYYRLGLRINDESLTGDNIESMGLMPHIAPSKNGLFSGYIPQLDEMDVSAWLSNWRAVGLL